MRRKCTDNQFQDENKETSKEISHILTIYKRLVTTSQKTRNMALIKFSRVQDVQENQMKFSQSYRLT
jgi:hypothetical protein